LCWQVLFNSWSRQYRQKKSLSVTNWNKQSTCSDSPRLLATNKVESLIANSPYVYKLSFGRSLSNCFIGVTFRIALLVYFKKENAIVLDLILVGDTKLIARTTSAILFFKTVQCFEIDTNLVLVVSCYYLLRSPLLTINCQYWCISLVQYARSCGSAIG